MSDISSKNLTKNLNRQNTYVLNKEQRYEYSHAHSAKILKLPATFQYHQNSHPTELAVFAFKMF
jgi:hypothetical protein